MNMESRETETDARTSDGEFVEVKLGLERRPEVQLLREMLDIRSLSGQERGLAEFLCEQAHVLGLTACIDEVGNFVACTKGDPLRTATRVKDIVLVGHMDVVPGEVAIRFEGDLLYGRGAVDAKGPLAGFLLAASRIKLPENVRVVVVGAVEEEAGSSRGARGIVQRYQPVACVIGEPSGWDGVTIGYKGRLIVRYSLERTVSHTAGPALSPADECVRWWHGVLERLSRIEEALWSERGASPNDPSAKVNANATGISAPKTVGPFYRVQATLRGINTSSDGLTSRVEAHASIRLPPGVLPGEIRNLCVQDAGEATLDFEGDEVAVVAERSSDLVRAFTQCIRKHGGKPALLLKTGTSDMNVVAAPGAWDCPILAYGAGDSALDHTPIEHVNMREYLRAIEILSEGLELFGMSLSAAAT